MMVDYKAFAVSVELALCMCTFLLYLFKITKYTWSNHIQKNKLTTVPFVTVALYLISLMIMYLLEYYHAL